MKVLKTAKMAAPFVKGLHSVGKFTTKNSNWILGLLALIGLTGTTWQMVDATIKAVKLCEEKQIRGTKEIIRTVWKLYIPGAGFIILTTIAIAGQTRLSFKLSKQLATVTGMYVASQTDLKTFKEKTKELFGEGKEKKVEEAVVQDKVNKALPPKETDIVETGHGRQLFQLGLTGGYFRANPDWVRGNVKTLDDELHNDPTNTLYVHRLLELFKQPEADIGNLYWDLYAMLQRGEKHITCDITTCKWVEYKGAPEVVSVVDITPWPTGF